MDSWLRPVFTRRGTSSALPPTPEIEQAASFVEESTDGDDDGLRMRSPSRTSILSFSGHNDSPRLRGFFGSFSWSTNLILDNLPHTSPTDEWPLYKPDQVWVQPSANHMVESLKVVMMKLSALETVPVEFNSSILHVLEAYHDLSVEIAKKEWDIALLKDTIELHRNDFDEIANKWVLKEKDYKAEIKRLEVILSKTNGGMESVTLARSGSIVHGSSGVSDIVNSRMKNMKRRSRPGSRDGEQEDALTFDEETPKKVTLSGRTLQKRYDPDAHMSAALEILGCRIKHGRAEPSQQEIRKKVAESYQDVQRREIYGRNNNAPPRILKTEILADVKKQIQGSRFRPLNHSPDGSTTDGSDTGMIMGGRNLKKSNEMTTQTTPQTGQGNKTWPDKALSLQTSPLLTLPTKPSTGTPPLAGTIVSLEATREMAFSFQPGDDNDILALELLRDRAKRNNAEYNLHQTARTSFKMSEPPKSRNFVQTRGVPPSMPATKAKPQISQSLQTYHGMTREDSNNSIQTVVRDNSSHRSSCNNSPASPQPQGRSIRRSEAVTAATIALAATKPRSRLNSDNGSLEEDYGLDGTCVVIRKKSEGDGRTR